MTKKNPVPPALVTKKNSSESSNNSRGTRKTEANIEANISERRNKCNKGLRLSLENCQQNIHVDNYIDEK